MFHAEINATEFYIFHLSKYYFQFKRNKLHISFKKKTQKD